MILFNTISILFNLCMAGLNAGLLYNSNRGVIDFTIFVGAMLLHALLVYVHLNFLAKSINK